MKPLVRLAVLFCGVTTMSHSYTEPAKAHSASLPSHDRTLRVCSDPNNLPFSNDRQEGFENKIAEVLAHDLHARLEYVWWAQRRGFIRNTLKAGACDLIIGVASSMDMLSTTTPYYKSTYMFVSRLDRKLDVTSFESPLLRKLKVGVHIIGDDYANTPPVHALARRGITNVHGYRLLDDYRQPNPPARILEAVTRGEIDVAIVWGPLAGFFAKRQSVPLKLVPVSPAMDPPTPPCVYAISMGVRQADRTLKREVEAAIERRRASIDRILAEYHVPRVDLQRRPE